MFSLRFGLGVDADAFFVGQISVARDRGAVFGGVGGYFPLSFFDVGTVDEVESEDFDFFKVVVVISEGFEFFLPTIEPNWVVLVTTIL